MLWLRINNENTLATKVTLGKTYFYKFSNNTNCIRSTEFSTNPILEQTDN